jgi:hypothetical protein
LGQATPLTSLIRRVEPVSRADEQLLPVDGPLSDLLPGAGLRRGSTVVICPGPVAGTTSLALSLLAASQAGSWCAAVGLPELGLVAAAGVGVSLDRFALVPNPGEQWSMVTAALIDAVDVVLVRPPRRVRLTDARRLVARARERGSVLVPISSTWSEAADIRLRVVAGAWDGLGQGHGVLQARTVEVVATGRGAASRERRVLLWLPAPDGKVAVAEAVEAQAVEAQAVEAQAEAV